jgi:hypothetical protein
MRTKNKTFHPNFKNAVSFVLCVLLVFVFFAGDGSFFYTSSQNTNPPDTVIRAKLKEMALKYNIPSVILMGIAYTESGWRQFDASGNPVIHYNTSGSFDTGIMQINSVGRSDIDRLKTDIFYNIEIGAKILDNKWKITPGIGDRDRNVLENWYYAVWAYNGFSYTNHPENPTGRHYQDRVLDNIAKLILASDGQPLWTPMQISRPDPNTILNPPDWIPTPTPYHYGDLYAGIYEGDNARLLAGPDGSIVPVNLDFSISFEMQNVGTTTWKNTIFSKDGDYHAVLKISKGSSLKLVNSVLSSPVQPGENTIFNFTASLPEEGQYSLTLEMYNGNNLFGPSVQTSLFAYNINVDDLSLPFDHPFKVNDTIPIKFRLNFKDRVNLSAQIQITLKDVDGNILYSKFVIPETLLNGNTEDISEKFIVGSGIANNGQYRFNIKLFLQNGTLGAFPAEKSISINPVFKEFEKDFVIDDSRNGLFVDSNPQGANIVINGLTADLTTPSFVALDSGDYAVTLSKADFVNNSFRFTAQGGIQSVSKDLTAIPQYLNLNLSSQNLDFGEIYTGVSTFKNIKLQFDGITDQTGVVGVSSKWINVYPLSFTSSTTFTVSVDSRWLEEGKVLSGTITFDTGTVKKTLPVNVATLFSSVVFSLVPDKATIREGENIFIDAFVKSSINLIDKVSFVLSYDSAFFNAISIVPDSANFAVNNLSQDKGFISFDGTNISNTTGELKILTVEFTALKNTSESKSLINFNNAKAFSNGEELKSLSYGSEIQILEKLKLPHKVLNLRIEDLLGKIKLIWTMGESGSYPVKEYEVFRSKADILSDAIYIGSVSKDIFSFTDTGPFERVPYYYWVIATDSMNNSSEAAGPIKIQPIVISRPLPPIVKLEFYIGKPVVYVNGITVNMEVAPFIKDGRTFVPVRYVAEPFGAQVIWNGNERKVILIHKKFIELWIGNPQAMIDGTPINIDPINTLVTPFIMEGRTLLPLRFVSEAFGATVTWDPTTKKVTIEYKN